MNAKTLVLALAAFACALVSSADPRVFPAEGFSGGKKLFALAGEPRRDFAAKVEVTTAEDHVSVDSRAAFAAGMTKLQMHSGEIFDKSFLGKELSLIIKAGGSKGAVMRIYFEGYSKEGKHWYRSRDITLADRAKEFSMIQGPVPEDLARLHLRYDIVKPGKGVVEVYSTKYGTCAEMEGVMPTVKAVTPELIFHAPFDGSATAAVARGGAEPLKASGIEFVAEGRRGGAARFSTAAKSALEYARAGNVDSVRGTVAMWVKREWKGDSRPWRSLFAYPQPSKRIGSGALWLWWLGNVLRADQSDIDDTYKQYGKIPDDGEWVHVAFTWNELGSQLYVNGMFAGGTKSDSHSAMKAALKPKDVLSFDRVEPDKFFVGCRSGREQLDGLIDELRIYSAPLSPMAVKALWLEDARELAPKKPDYSDFAKGENPYEKPAGEKLDMELVSEWKAGEGEKADSFRAVGDTQVKELGGVKYLEAGPDAGDRFALRLSLKEDSPLWCLEIDYPDDAKRTADIIVQSCKQTWNDYSLQVGYASGDEYRPTGRILTHRCLYWKEADDVALVVMTARKGAPAAVSAVRLYRVRDAKLPSAGAPGAREGRRSFVAYNEDCAIGYDFGTVRTKGHDRDELQTMIERCAAYMKYIGEDILAYPGCWYQGRINEDYNPRNHAPDYLSAWYSAFDREGLGVMPTMNWHNIELPPDVHVTRESLSDGSLHPTAVNILSSGRANTEWHGSPPNFNILHPATQAAILREFDGMLDEGAAHPSFRGVCLHLTAHSILWWGTIDGGYNDYAVEAFSKATGVKVPANAGDPLRGRAYAEWIKANARDEWVRWRCSVVTDFFAVLAERLRSRRADLKLWVNTFTAASLGGERPLDADYITRMNLDAGLDGAALQERIPNLILCQSVVPADYRWRGYGPGSGDLGRRQLELPTDERTFDLLQFAKEPWVNQHDRYWESAIGKTAGKSTLTCDWLKECSWRVSTINPSGRHALSHFVEPLRYHDITGMSKGGFLIGTYGMEDVLVPFMRAFRALPAVVMKDVTAKCVSGDDSGFVRLRGAVTGGKAYFYVVNTGYEPSKFTLRIPAGAKDLVTGEPVVSGEMSLDGYELRSFAIDR